MESIYNCHTHIFTNKNVPENLLPFGFRSLLCVTETLANLSKKLKPDGGYNVFDKVATIGIVGNFRSQLGVFNHLKGFYPDGSKFVLISVDMEFMGAGRVAQGFPEQLRQLSDIKKSYRDRVFPFIFVDPRRENITDLVKEYIEEHDFQGIKMNPTYGYYVFDKRLYQIYKYAATNKVPVISHCARSWAYYKGRITDDMLIHPGTGRRLRRTWNKRFAEHFTHPGNYEYLLRDFPDLKICLAHLGGGDELKNYKRGEENKRENWSSIIIDYMKRYPNVYTDVSYTMHDPKLFPQLKGILDDRELRSRVLYGSDFYMVQQEIHERDFHENLKSYLGEDDYRQIAMINPQEFLSMEDALVLSDTEAMSLN